MAASMLAALDEVILTWGPLIYLIVLVAMVAMVVRLVRRRR